MPQTDLSKLQQEIISLKELQKKKDDLVNMVIHDLKGPLSEIISNLDILSYSKNLNETDREVLDTANEGCNNLHSLILTLLDISKMEDDKLKLNISELSINDLILNKIKKMEVIASQDNIKFSYTENTSLSKIEADYELIERVLTNLLLNAISYSKPGGEVQIKASQKNDFLMVSVRDYGKGIPKEFQIYIFEKFEQVIDGGSKKPGSTGLGLTFCKMAVDAHKGRIEVKSKEGEGSEFYFLLPLKT